MNIIPDRFYTIVILMIGLWHTLLLAEPTDNFQSIQLDKQTINFKIREDKVEQLRNQAVVIPARLIKIWQSLQQHIDFEVGGGLDFNYLKEVERMKLSHGKDKSVTFYPDFEIAWHTHPTSDLSGAFSSFSPPSAADIQILIVGNYNLWLLLNDKMAADFSNSLVLKTFSEDISKPSVVEKQIVIDADGVYLYTSDKYYWEKIWRQDDNAVRAALTSFGGQLQSVINQYFIQVAEKKISPDRARSELLEAYSKIAHVDVKFYSWRVLEKGLKVNLDIVELYNIHRKR